MSSFTMAHYADDGEYFYYEYSCLYRHDAYTDGERESPATYETNEGCLCHEGAKNVTRHEEIEVEFLDLRMKKCRVKYSGITAEIIQHEMDHLEGILI